MANPMYGQNKLDSKIDLVHGKSRVYHFGAPPILQDDLIYGGAYSDPDGGDNDVVIHQYPDGLQLSCAYMGAVDEDGPSIASTGMNYEAGDTDNEGFQWVMSYPGSKGVEGVDSFTVGKAAFYAKLRWNIETVAGVDYCFFGFRLKSQASVAEPRGSATDYAVIGNNNGDIDAETALNNSTNTVVDTTDSWTDGESKTMEVYVALDGAATFKIDGQSPTVNTQAVTFDSADVLTPWFVVLKDNGASCNCILERLEVGLQ